MSADYYAAKNIHYVCFHFTIDGEEYPDDMGESMPFDEFFRRVAKGSSPTTSQVNVEQYMNFFEPFLLKGKDILHISLSSGISGTYSSARVAADALKSKYPGRKLYVVDSLAASSGYGLLMDGAAAKRDEGMNIDDIYRWTEERKYHIHHWFFSTDLSHLRRGGRISAAAAAIGTLLNICPIFHVDHEGKLIPQIKVRGKAKALAKVIDIMKDHAEEGMEYSGKCFISNSACPEDARQLAESVENTFPRLDGRVIINSIGTVIGSHTGPGTIALFFYGDSRRKDCPGD
jgi:DegV family protein with EDD domain